MRTHKSSRRARIEAIFVFGVLGTVVVPAAIAVICTSWSTPTGTDYIRMAFATVAGCTVATYTAIIIVILLWRYRDIWIRIGSVGIALAVLVWAYWSVVGAAQRLAESVIGA